MKLLYASKRVRTKKSNKQYRISLAFVLLLVNGFFVTAGAQNKPKLFVSVLESHGYTVGAKNNSIGLFSYNGNKEWTHYAWPNNRLYNMAYNPQNIKEMYMACGDGVFRTLDGGKNWMRMTGWTITEVQDVTVNPFKPNEVYIASAYGIWRSTDSGARWDSASVGLDSTFTETIQVDKKNGSYLVVAGEGGIYRSTNGARSWTHVGPDVPVRHVVQSKSTPDLWLAATAGHGAMISEDGGKTWHFLRGKLSGKTLYTVAIDPYDSKRMATAGYETGVFISTNGGRSWVRRTNGLPTKNLHSLIFDPVVKGRLWAGTYNHGIYVTDNLGKSWQYKGLGTSQVYNMTFVGGDK